MRQQQDDRAAVGEFQHGCDLKVSMPCASRAGSDLHVWRSGLD
jgi:hypothetical protein